ncbi:LysR family transcriptional regulator (plasmid) [Ralstonia sp. R-29]|uniref:LysR family transcriptional regulator n=1 Tax=Ralstonia sp. R-29 TaxID=3404059 RepID=UPI003CEA530A
MKPTQAAKANKVAMAEMPLPMVSRSIGQLEQQCGQRLFRRTGRSVVLTVLRAYLLFQA